MVILALWYNFLYSNVFRMSTQSSNGKNINELYDGKIEYMRENYCYFKAYEDSEHWFGMVAAAARLRTCTPLLCSTLLLAYREVN